MVPQPEPIDTPQPALPPKRSPWPIARGTLIALALVAGAVLALAFAVSATLTRAAPSWWTHPTADATTSARGTALENAAVSQLYLARDAAERSPPNGVRYASEPWSVALSESDVNAWLATRLPRWLEGESGMPEWPDTMSQLQVRLDRGAVRAGVRVETRSGPRFVTASFVPSVDDRGSLWCAASVVHVGRLPVPASWVIAGAADGEGVLPAELASHPNAEQFVDMARGRAPFAATPLLGLENDRRVRLLDVQVRPGRLELTMRTEIREPIH
ncbi:MAG: hypothetical protein AAF297_09980 [Planctomycetota bacterium]